MVLGKNEFDGPLYLPIAKSLEEVRIQNNNFRGVLPENLYKLENLRYLHANDNNFIGGISPSIGNLTSLRELILNDNYLNGEVPEELQNIDNLTYLWLHHNNFNGSVPSAVCTAFSGSLKSFWADCKNDLDDDDSELPELECACCTFCCNPGNESKCDSMAG